MTQDFTAWIGRTEEAHDILEPVRVNALAAALGSGAVLKAGDVMPPLRHWLYFWDVRAPAGLGPDGHPARGGFLPAVPLPRRMWAGGRVRFHAPLHLGEAVTRTSTITNVQAKNGKSGDLVFVTVEHRISGEAGLAMIEEQDLVYKGETAAGAIAAPAGDNNAPDAAWREAVTPDSVLLFRYSALTMNGHRIHYDLAYARDEEAYPGLVVHGPLQATLLADLAAARLGRSLRSFDFRGLSPAFAGPDLHVCGDPQGDGASLWTQQCGAKNMTATAA